MENKKLIPWLVYGGICIYTPHPFVFGEPFQIRGWGVGIMCLFFNDIASKYSLINLKAFLITLKPTFLVYGQFQWSAILDKYNKNLYNHGDLSSLITAMYNIVVIYTTVWKVLSEALNALWCSILYAYRQAIKVFIDMYHYLLWCY